MTELFLVNRAYFEQDDRWECYKATRSIHEAVITAQQLKDMGQRVTIQSVLLNEEGKVEL